MSGGQMKTPVQCDLQPGLDNRYANAADIPKIARDTGRDKAEPAALREAKLRALGLSAARAALLAALVWEVFHG